MVLFFWKKLKSQVTNREKVLDSIEWNLANGHNLKVKKKKKEI